MYTTLNSLPIVKTVPINTMQINKNNQISLLFRVNTFPIVYNPETQKHFTKLERPKDEGELMDTSSEVGKLISV